MKTEKTKDFTVSWDELHRQGRELAWRLLKLKPFTGIIAVTRGGLVPASIVARELNIRLIDTIGIASYDHKTQGLPKIIKAAQTNNGAGWLIIEDLVDTGATAAIIRKSLPEAHFATIYAKPSGQLLVDTFVTEVNQDTWIHFPWDLSLVYTPPICDTD